MKATSTKERPIVFTSESVRAILAGQKTMTRRVVKPTQSKPKVAPLEMEPWIIGGYHEEDDDGRPYWAGSHPDYPTGKKWFTCPYGAVGDRLWVRETWSTQGWYAVNHEHFMKSPKECPPDALMKGKVYYRADGDDWLEGEQERTLLARDVRGHAGWRPSIFMPRWASRLTLEIVSVRVERLQDITEEDAIAEGAQVIPCGRATWTEREAFALLWDSINAKRGLPWESNPWIWAIAFRRLP